MREAMRAYVNKGEPKKEYTVCECGAIKEQCTCEKKATFQKTTFNFAFSEDELQLDKNVIEDMVKQWRARTGNFNFDFDFEHFGWNK
jgi:hypothetical protein